MRRNEEIKAMVLKDFSISKETLDEILKAGHTDSGK